MLWSSFALVKGIAHARGVPMRVFAASTWRKRLGLHAERLDCPPRPAAASPVAEIKAWERQHARASAEASKRRKASTEVLMRKRWPFGAELIDRLARGLHEHAFDALAIAAAYLDEKRADEARLQTDLPF